MAPGLDVSQAISQWLFLTQTLTTVRASCSVTAGSEPDPAKATGLLRETIPAEIDMESDESRANKLSQIH
jgi:hypothetical protein